MNNQTDFETMNLDDISTAIQTCGAQAFRLGAVKEITLKNGDTYKIQVTDRTDGLLLSFRDLFGKNVVGGMRINTDRPYGRKYAESDLRKWLNSEFLDLLPDGFVKHIAEKKIESGGKILSDKVFIPSEAEIYGKRIYGNNEEGKQFELYEDWHNRIAGYTDGEYGRWWWTRTASSSTSFCLVGNYGCSIYYYASDSGGVRPHFLIK